MYIRNNQLMQGHEKIYERSRQAAECFIIEISMQNNPQCHELQVKIGDSCYGRTAVPTCARP